MNKQLLILDDSMDNIKKSEPIWRSNSYVEFSLRMHWPIGINHLRDKVDCIWIFKSDTNRDGERKEKQIVKKDNLKTS